MALLTQWTLDDGSSTAIWKIEEPESFFIEATELTFPEIRNEKRRIERLAGRFLLKLLREDFPIHLIRPDANDKPRIAGNQYYFSISHSWPYVAVVVRPDSEAGIDIQCWHPRIHLLQEKFLSREEQILTGNDQKLITLAWAAKEATYKWQGVRGIDFIHQLPITHLNQQFSKEIFNITIINHFDTSKYPATLQGIVFEDFVVSNVITNLRK